MAIIEGVAQNLISLPADYPRMQRYDVICVHTIVGYWAGGTAAHFTTDYKGVARQHRDTKFQSAANLNGNHRVIAIENEDHGLAYGSWNTSDGHSVPAFTDAQCEGLAQLIAKIAKVHNIPIQLVPDSKSTSRGIAYHRQGIDSANNFAGYAYKGRVAGGELWSKATGKVCPGDRRITQLINVIIPRAKEIAGGGDDLPLNDLDIAKIVNAVRYQVLASNEFRFDGRNFADGMVETVNTGFRNEKRLDDLGAKVTELESKISAPVPVDIDYDILADKVVERLGSVRFEPIDKA